MVIERDRRGGGEDVCSYCLCMCRVYQLLFTCSVRNFIYSSNSHVYNMVIFRFRYTRNSTHLIIFGSHAHESLDSWKHTLIVTRLLGLPLPFPPLNKLMTSGRHRGMFNEIWLLVTQTLWLDIDRPIVDNQDRRIPEPGYSYTKFHCTVFMIDEYNDSTREWIFSYFLFDFLYAFRYKKNKSGCS